MAMITSVTVDTPVETAGDIDGREAGATLIMLPPTSDLELSWVVRLRGLVPNLTVIVAANTNEATVALRTADAAYGFLPAELLEEAPNLRWLQAPMAAPPAGYFHPNLVSHPVVVTNMRDTYSDHVAVHVLASLLFFARGLHRYMRQQLAGEWRPGRADTGVVYLPEATVLIVGLGGIGSAVARLLVPFGANVVAVDAVRSERPEGVRKIHPPEDLEALLPYADFVVLTIPHTPATEGLMDLKKFRAMKQGAFFVNVGRGMTVRLTDLMVALKAGVVAGAALDVFEHEPLPPEHELWRMPNVLLTPHVAAYGPHKAERRFQVFLKNCLDFLENKPLMNAVDKFRWF